MRVFYALFFFLGVTSPLHSVAQQSIVGSWKVDIQASVNQLSDAGKDRYSQIPTEMKSTMEQSMGSRLLTFYDNGSMTMQASTRKEPAQGTWVFKRGASGRLLVITMDSQVTEMKVVQLTSTTLILELGDTNGVYEKLYLNKI